MKQITSEELRTAWINFYKERGHVDVGAVSLVSDGSTGVLFNVAGMQPIMPYLLGQKHPLGTRLCNVQGCVRTNDIDSVGDKSHVTFFEMMGSWSLGDYFKEDRCKWSYELLTQVLGFDKEHLAATVFAGDENAPRDEEGAQYRIASGFLKEHIYYLPAEDNWWGLEYGPCGPDSEMFYIEDKPDCGPNCGPGCHCGKYTELGNDVFMQYEKHKDGSLTPLKQKNVDTGWGLERILAFLSGTKDVYQTDLFAPIIGYIEKVSGYRYNENEKTTKSMRVLSDHIRTSVMLIGDEAKLLPSNTGAGYVLRRLIRRAVRHGRMLSLNAENLLVIASMYINDIYRNSYPLLTKNKEFILNELQKEIARFESTLENGMKEFKKILDGKNQNKETVIDGDAAFYLYDTFGFPIELTVELAEEEGLTVNEADFLKAMEAQKQKARENQSFQAKLTVGAGLFDELPESFKSEFIGYEHLSCESTILAIATDSELVKEISAFSNATIIVNKTPFYATMGGQKGDIGVIKAGDALFEVTDTIKLSGDRIGHIGKVVNGSFKSGETVNLVVDTVNHMATCRNHSATHLLQKALQMVLGDHVEQQGSFQDQSRTRFDFSHDKALSEEEVSRVEAIVCEQINASLPVSTREMSLEDAKKTGAMALFGEKYGATVRVVSMGDFSVELCGGTHVKNTADIQTFKILSESGVAAGVRRIEALTGANVLAYYQNMEENYKKAAAAAKTTPATLVDKIQHMQTDLKTLSSENESLKAKLNQNAMGDIANQVLDIKDVKMIAACVNGVDMNGLRDLGDQLKLQIGEGVIVLLSEQDGKVNMIAMATDEAVKKGAHAGNLIKGIASLVGGGGGGRPNMAQAGGKNPKGINDALREAQNVLSNMIS